MIEFHFHLFGFILISLFSCINVACHYLFSVKIWLAYYEQLLKSLEPSSNTPFSLLKEVGSSSVFFFFVGYVFLCILLTYLLTFM